MRINLRALVPLASYEMDCRRIRTKALTPVRERLERVDSFDTNEAA
jgi:hypothetical protein